jgi:ketosteroid isomerase-like protein
MKKLLIRSVSLIFSMLLLLGCVPQPRDVTDQIQEANKPFMEAFNRGDVAAVAAHYTAKARVRPPNSDVIEGQNDIQNFWQGVLDMGIKKVELKTIKATAFGKTANEEGKYTLFAENDIQVDHGKFIVIWQKVAGNWKLDYDIWNSNNPPPIARANENDTVWIVWNTIKANKVKQFEDFNFNYLEPAVAEYYPKMKRTVRTLRQIEPNKDGTFTYLYLMDPAISPDGYAMTLPLTAKYGEKRASEYLNMFTSCLKGGEQEWVVTVQTKW